MQTNDPTQTILKRWPSRQAVADDTGVALVAVHRWWQRKSIPAKYDAALLDAASRRNIPLNWRELMDARSARPEHIGHTSADFKMTKSAGAA